MKATWSKEVEQYVPTNHAQTRMAQRNLTLDEVYFVLEHGQRIHRAGAVFYFLGKRDIPKELRSSQEHMRLEGSVVVTSRHLPQIITVYRNRSNGLRRIKRKVQWDCRPYYSSNGNGHAFR